MGIIVFAATGGAEVANMAFQERRQVGDTGDNILMQVRWRFIVFRLEKLTPTLNSIVPHRTSMVELPSPKATRWICVNRRIEQIVVKRPNRKRHTTPAFCAGLMFRRSSSGMGRKIIITSQMMVKMARP